MGPFLRKDVLVYWRDRKEILMALVLPIIIIVVLNFAFSGLFDRDSQIDIDVGIVLEDEEVLGIEQLGQTIEGLDISSTEKEDLMEQAKQISPVGLFYEFINNPELKDWISTKEVEETEAIELVEAGELDAIIKIPEGFTFEILSQVMLGEQSDTPIVIRAEEHSSELSALQHIVQNFTSTLNVEFALGSQAGKDTMEPQPVGGIESVENVESYTMAQYFTIAIGILFAMFISQTIALKTVTEKRERVFNRIVLSNSNPIHFLMGKTIAAFCLAWLQLMITITVTQLILDVFPDKTVAFWFGLIAVITTFALAVAGLCALFTILALNMEDSNAVSGLTTLIIMTFAVLGGSFFPIQGLPEIMRGIGEWTPNGLAMTALLEWIQYTNLESIMLPIIINIAFLIVCMVIGFAIFPRRGRV